MLRRNINLKGIKMDYFITDTELSKVVAKARREQAKEFVRIGGLLVKGIKHVFGYVGRFFNTVQVCKELEANFDNLNKRDQIRDKLLRDGHLFF